MRLCTNIHTHMHIMKFLFKKSYYIQTVTELQIIHFGDILTETCTVSLIICVPLSEHNLEMCAYSIYKFKLCTANIYKKYGLMAQHFA